jgi:hypothetical protein
MSGLFGRPSPPGKFPFPAHSGDWFDDCMVGQIQNQQPILQEQLASQLAGTGTSLINAGASSAGLSGQLFSTLVANDTTQAANAGKAIASLAAPLSGKSQATIGSTPVTIG